MQRLFALQPRGVAVRESRIHARTIIQPFGGEQVTLLRSSASR